MWSGLLNASAAVQMIRDHGRSVSWVYGYSRTDRRSWLVNRLVLRYTFLRATRLA